MCVHVVYVFFCEEGMHCPHYLCTSSFIHLSLCFSFLALYLAYIIDGSDCVVYAVLCIVLKCHHSLFTL